MRRGEAWNLKWTDLDFQNKSVCVTPEKGGNPRVLEISSRLVAMLKLLPQQTYAHARIIAFPNMCRRLLAQPDGLHTYR